MTVYGFMFYVHMAWIAMKWIIWVGCKTKHTNKKKTIQFAYVSFLGNFLLSTIAVDSESIFEHSMLGHATWMWHMKYIVIRNVFFP